MNTAKALNILGREIIDTAKTLVWVVAIFLVLRILLFQPFTIPSSSMEPGLVTGDYIVVSKFDYGWSRASLPFNPPIGHGRLFNRLPARGDVVVFRLPRDPNQTWIKRVIGLPGDKVQLIGGLVWVNGKAIPQQSLSAAPDYDMPEREVMQVRETKPSGKPYLTYDGGLSEVDDTPVYIVPAGNYFVMGDNRDDSADSRFPREVGVGFLPAENLVGKARVVLMS